MLVQHICSQGKARLRCHTSEIAPAKLFNGGVSALCGALHKAELLKLGLLQPPIQCRPFLTVVLSYLWDSNTAANLRWSN